MSADLVELLHTRRSVREFQDRPIPLGLLEEVLEAALWAPSAYNGQPWHFVVTRREVRDRAVELLARRADAFGPGLHARFPAKLVDRILRFFATMGGAPVVVFAFAESEDPAGGGEPRADSQGAYASTCAAVQTLLLAAHARGLGACWVQAFSIAEEELAGLLGQGGRQLVAGIPLGLPARVPATPPRRVGTLSWLGFSAEA